MMTTMAKSDGQDGEILIVFVAGEVPIRTEPGEQERPSRGGAGGRGRGGRRGGAGS